VANGPNIFQMLLVYLAAVLQSVSMSSGIIQIIFQPRFIWNMAFKMEMVLLESEYWRSG